MPTYSMMADAKILKKISDLPYKILLAFFILSSLVTIAAMRHNNQTMVKLRTAVYEADRSGGNTEKALTDLRSYVYAHMNTNLASGNNAIKPPIQLKYTYERLTAAEQARVDNANGRIYTDAKNYCEAKIPASVSISGRGRIECVSDYVLSHGGISTQAISPALYQFDFISPAWSPDLAGWSLLVSTILFLFTVCSFAADKLVAAKLQHR